MSTRHGHDVHAEPHAPPPPPTGWRRLTAAGWLRAAWMTPLFCGHRRRHRRRPPLDRRLGPDLEWQVIVVVAFLTTVPIGFLAGIGAFDYWVYYVLGCPTRPEDHSATAPTAGRTTSASTPTTR